MEYKWGRMRTNEITHKVIHCVIPPPKEKYVGSREDTEVDGSFIFLAHLSLTHMHTYMSAYNTMKKYKYQITSYRLSHTNSLSLALSLSNSLLHPVFISTFSPLPTHFSQPLPLSLCLSLSLSLAIYPSIYPSICLDVYLCLYIERPDIDKY